MLLRAHDPFSGHVDEDAPTFPEGMPAVTITDDAVAQRVTDALASMGVTVVATEVVAEPPVPVQPAVPARKAARVRKPRRRATRAEVADAVKRMDS